VPDLASLLAPAQPVVAPLLLGGGVGSPTRMLAILPE
jgi:hypothetical protein